MSLEKRYDPNEVEPRLQAYWQESGIYHFSPQQGGEVFSVDTPPATVSGHLHLGHVYSYTHVDLIARFWRMRGRQVFYPMGYDDNGLPTERLVERQLGVRATEIGRQAFIQHCLQVSEEAEKDYRDLWQRLGLSIDWRYTYRTIDELSRRTAQFSFIDLYRKGLVYRREAPTIWCPECRTAIAQAEEVDLERESEFVTLKFALSPDLHDQASPHKDIETGGEFIPIATTRPELLPACVAIFVHPDDARYRGLAGRQAITPLFGQSVPILEDPGADPAKGSGAVMCCTFGDTADVAWWNLYGLPLVEAIGSDGRMTQAAGIMAGLPVETARRQVKESLEASGSILGRQPTLQTIRVHERCDTPVEYIVTRQWFIRLLQYKDELIKRGEEVAWHPESMRLRYRSWVENLNWDWCISRQRYFGVPFPVWYCEDCGETILAEERQLPVDPLTDRPVQPCACGSTRFKPEEDIYDTWMTSSMSPQIAGHWLKEPPGTLPSPSRRGEASSESQSSLVTHGEAGSEPHTTAIAEGERAPERLFERVFPFSLRPQGHEIIRTWAFYTILKSEYHLGQLPWKAALISGWGVAGEGMGKISKSRGGGPMSPLEMIQRYSADAVRYWAASTGPGKNSVINEEKIAVGAKLATKLWNVARFAEPFISMPQLDLRMDSEPDPAKGEDFNSLKHLIKDRLSPADRWIRSRTQRLIERVTDLMEAYEYAAAKSEVEGFFWTELADNYLEMCKQRLYESTGPEQEAAKATLSETLLMTIKLFSPFLPYVTEAIYLGLFQAADPRLAGKPASIHTSPWPIPNPALADDDSEAAGRELVTIATAIRRYKSERSLPLGRELEEIGLYAEQPEARSRLEAARSDLMSITRARKIRVVEALTPTADILQAGDIRISIIL